MHDYKRSTYAGVLPAGRLDPISVELTVEQSRRLLAQKHAALFAGFVDGEAAGLVGVRPLRWKQSIPPEYTSEIHSFYVKPKFRPRHRLADRLWIEAVEWLKREQMRRVIAFILESNRLGRAYAKLRGGTVIAEKPGDGLWARQTILIYGIDLLAAPPQFVRRRNAG
jgi:hypothetical protein